MRRYLVSTFLLLFLLALGRAAFAQPALGSVTVGVPTVSASQLPTCSAANDTAYYKVTDNTGSCQYPNSVAGGGTNQCFVQCTSGTWQLATPPNGSPPTVINVLTGTGGGFTNCVQGTSTSGCATGAAQFAVGNVTTASANLTFSSPSFNLTTGCAGGSCAGANIAILQQDGTTTASGGHPQYNGCYAMGTILSVQSATAGTMNTPGTKNGSNCGTGLATSTVGTAVVWDGKDNNVYTAITQAGTLASAYNAGAIVYLPAGTYVIYTANYGGGTNQLAANVKIQCQSPSTTTIVMPLFDGNNNDTFTPNSNNDISGCTFTELDTAGFEDYVGGRAQFGGWIADGGTASNRIRLSGNVFENSASDQGIPLAAHPTTGSPPCPYGQEPNSAASCTPVPVAWTITNNTFKNCGNRAVQISAGADISVDHNTLINCDASLEYNAANPTVQMFMGNSFSNNDLHCTSGSGLYKSFIAAGLSKPSVAGLTGNGCGLDSTDDQGSRNMGSSSFENNHMHADTTGATATCLDGSNGTKSVKTGNKCISGENCANTSGC